MKIAYYSIDEPDFACAQLRVLGPLGLLRGEVELAFGVERTIYRAGGPFKRTGFTVDGRLADAADLVIFQRGFPSAHWVDAVADILAAGKPIVYETDDDLRIVPQWHDKPYYLENAPYVEALVRRATLVTVATPRLAERYAELNRATTVLPNRLPHFVWQGATPFRKRSDRLTIGYCGTSTHTMDLQQVEDALIETSRRHPDVQLVFLGCVTERLRRLPNSRYIEYAGDYLSWPRRLAEAAIDIAVVPLIDDTFNSCKSAIKFLELGYLEIPTVFSDVLAYQGAVEQGVTGLLVGPDTAAWVDALERLIADPALRARIGANARREVMAHHLLEQHCGRWLETYRGLLR